jgi:L,D-peptidoglycan transpeptidase YkuD (ErfK/YbiS/YcfS/YnhG family)
MTFRMSRSYSHIVVRRAAGQRSRGWLIGGNLRVPVTLGRGGIRADKREGDGATPRGCFRPLRLWWRADRLRRPQTALPVRPIGPDDAWCEDPRDPRYNRPIRLAAGTGGDRLRRTDRLYDLIVEIDHNSRPRIAGRGSAIFIHVARPDRGPTAGCIGLRQPDLARLVGKLSLKTRIEIQS